MTRSSFLICLSTPSRITLQVEAVISFSASMAFSARPSWTTPRIAFKSTTPMMMKNSASSVVSKCPSPVITGISVVIRLMTAAMIKTMIIGLASCKKNLLTREIFLPSANLFLPFCSRRASASACDKPFSQDFTSSRTALPSKR